MRYMSSVTVLFLALLVLAALGLAAFPPKLPGTIYPRNFFFTPDLLMSAFPSRSKVPRRIGK